MKNQLSLKKKKNTVILAYGLIKAPINHEPKLLSGSSFLQQMHFFRGYKSGRLRGILVQHAVPCVNVAHSASAQ